MWDLMYEPESNSEHASFETRPYGRRAFLGVSALGLTSLLWGRSAWGEISKVLSPAASVLPRGVREVIPSGWRIYTVASTMPVFDPATWRLRIEGLVENPVELTYGQLKALPRSDQVSDFHCVTGWSVSNVRWGGVHFRDLLDLAKPKPQATALAFVSAEEPYIDTLTMKQALLDDAMLAFEMDGEPLPRPHGAPARVVIPEMYGYKNVKWVNRIVVLANPADGYWEQRGYDRDAWVGRSNGFSS
jgi:DMSO/TMAO reductase YedYZ molybdopterin-dependent catalytic subunit